MTVIKVVNERDIITKLSSYVEKISNDSIQNRGRFYVGLSGGSVLKYLSEALPTIDTDWSKWTLAFCDERVVPEDSDDSTFGAYKRSLIPKTLLKESQFVVLKQDVSAEEAAKDYTEKLEAAFHGSTFQFDLLLLGMGPDGHTCSLFPGHKLLEENNLRVAAISDSPKPPPARITLTYPVINMARNCIFAISGEGKADMVKLVDKIASSPLGNLGKHASIFGIIVTYHQRVVRDKEDLPAARVKPDNGSLYWIVDEGAAKHL